MNSNYFGTNTKSAGHYFWTLSGNYQGDSTLDVFRQLPFNPEQFTKSGKYGFKPKGSVEFHYIGGYSILAIAGSPIDTRAGCKSVFFFKEAFNDLELLNRVKSIPAAMSIINQMPFPVDHFTA